MTLGMLLALGPKDSYPKVPPEFAVDVGWLCFFFVVCCLLWAWTRAESIRRTVLSLDDPRVYAVLRVGFALMTIQCFWNLEPYWRMLWSDEGLFGIEYARERLGRTGLRGWSPDEGFFDIWAVLNFLWHKPSLFYFWGSPTFVVGYMIAFFAVLLLYAAGVFSRVTGVLAWFLMTCVYNRNALYWEGTDTVYRAFWFILLFAKTGHAWSFDNWWRCRRLRKKGRLREQDAAPDAPGEPIYRLVPSWPRWLFMLQLCAVYITTGAVKTGSVWARGDALYYALNMDHFYRFELVTQMLSAYIGTNVFRVMTWMTLWWERCFPIVMLGVGLKFSLTTRAEPWRRRLDAQRWRTWLGRAAAVGAYGLLYRINVLAYPFCIAMKDDTPKESAPGLEILHIVYGIAIPAAIAIWYVAGRWPLTLFKGSRKLWKLRFPQLVIDQEALRAWFVGRRVWLTLGASFHGFLILFMNIGMFPFITLMTYAAFVRGEEWGRFVAWLFRLLRRFRLGRLVPRNADVLVGPAQEPESVRVRGRRVPDLAVLIMGLTGAGLVYLKVEKVDWVPQATYAWLAACLALATTFRFLKPTDGDRDAGRPALAYGSLGRALALFATVWHATAVGIHLFPSYSMFSRWRGSVRSIHAGWLRGTGTSQSWRMFAPNPPRSNSFQKTVVIEEDDDRWDLRNNAYLYRPNPWIWNDRMRKMQRRMIGKGKWYLKYWAQFHCREWALRTGEVPKEIEIIKIVNRIPGPDLVAKKGYYDPRKLKTTTSRVQGHKCTGDGLLSLEMKERYGLDVSEADRTLAAQKAERAAKKYERRRESWERRTDWGGNRPEKVRKTDTAVAVEKSKEDQDTESPAK